MGFSIQETADLGYIMTGEGSGGGNNHGFDLYLVRTDASGNLLWEKYFGGLGDDRGRAVRQTADDGYVAVGHTTSKGAGGADVYLIKTDASGNAQW